MPDQKLRIEIETAATGSGVQQTAAGVEKVASAAQKAAPAVGALGNQSKATSAELGRGVEVGNAASMAVQNLAASTKGGAAGFLSMARGAFGAGVALKGVLASLGPVGAIAAGVGIALGLITAALRKNEEAAEEAQKKLEEINKQKLDKAIEEQSKLGKAATAAVEQIEAERNALERIADAELALRKSRIDASDKSPEEKERLKLALDRQREEQKRAGVLADQEAKANKLADATSKSAKAARALEGEYNRQKNALDELTAATKAYDSAKAIVDLQAFAGDATPEDQQALLDARDRKQRAQAYATGVSPETIAAAKEAAKKALDQLAADRDRSEGARTGANREYDTQQEENRRRKETQANEDRANRPETDAEKAKREKDQALARSKAEHAVDSFGLEVWKNRAAGGNVDDVTLDVLKQRYPKVQFATPPKPSTPLTPPSTQSTASTPSIPSSPNAMRLGGGALPTTTTGVYAPGQALPTTAVGAGNQVTRGQLQPGSDNKDAKTAEALKGTTAAVKEQDTGKDTAKEAEALKKAAEEQSKAQQQAQAATKQALSAAKEVMSALTTTTNRHTSEIAMLRAQISAMRSRA